MRVRKDLPTRRNLLLGLAATPLLVRGAASRPLEKVAETKTLRVAVYEDHYPFCWKEGGSYRGLDVDIAGELAQALNARLDLVVRMSGEDVGGDLRANVWRGPLTGGGVADVMLHVPAEREFTRTLEHVVVANPYYRHSLAFAVDARTEHTPGYDLVNEAPFAVQSKSLSDYFLMSTFREGALKNLKHFVRLEEAVAAFQAKEVMAVAGPRAMLEGMLHPKKEGVRLYAPALSPQFRRDWIIGTAVKEDSRDLSYAVGDVLTRLRETGRMAEIFARYGVSLNLPA
jgi:polar amino acid transport system substrate-binding protein